ncbi:hypothetical protein AAVH_31215, partial [Aphelenchoides avenae]
MTEPSSGCAVIPYSSTAHHIVRGADFLFKLTSLIALAMNFPLPCFKRKTLTMHMNLKVLLANAALVYAVQALSSSTSIALKQFRVWLAVHGCVSPNPLWLCLLVRAPRFATSVGFSLVHVVILTERCVATYAADKYEKSGTRLSCLLTLMLWLSMACWTYWAFYDEFSHPYGYVSDCMMSLPTTLKMANSNYYSLAIDVIVSVADFVLLLVNRRQRNRYAGDYSLQKSYQMKENRLTTQIIFPCSIVHTAAYSSYLLVNGVLYTLFAKSLTPLTGTIMEATQWLISAYLWITLVFFYWIRRKIAATSFVADEPQAVDDYFKKFERLIASEATSNQQR